MPQGIRMVEAKTPFVNNAVNTSSNAVRSTASILDLLSKRNVDENGHETVIVPPNEDTPKSSDQVLKPTTSNTQQSCLTIFNVVYGKQTKKKHKTWEGDGVLEVGAKTITLKDEDGKVIGTSSISKGKEPVEGARLYVGSKEVEIIDVAEQRINEVKIETEARIEPKAKKQKVTQKKFQIPKVSCGQFESGQDCLLLPEPNAEHQWKFNQGGKVVSQVHVDFFLSRTLRPHQRFGLIFLYECIMGYRDYKFQGAILADEMGLGKTLQCIALIWTLLKKGPYGNVPVINKALIVTPSSLTQNWNKEFIKWLGQHRVTPLVVDKKTQLSKLSFHTIVIVSYEMFVRYFEDFQKHVFDLLVCDEGHRLKNTNNKASQLLSALLCDRKILLTGTPIQNDLQEFFALVDFVNPRCLGTFNEFHKRFEDPIVLSKQPDIDPDVKELGEERAAELNQITSRFILRRTQDILDKYLPKKHEVVLFCKPSDLQVKVYMELLEYLTFSKDNKDMFGGDLCHLEVMMMLRKICNHPALLSNDDEDTKSGTLQEHVKNILAAKQNIMSTDHSIKLTVVMRLLHELKTNHKHEKVVLVSNFTQTLDMLADVLNQRGYQTCRLDGSTSASSRSNIVDNFNNYSTCFVFLLSAKAGGVGLNLTGASRLVLYDIDWNPATDLQAMCRIWRDGQKYDVYIYRLLTTGMIEEKMFQRQMSKQCLSSGVLDSSSGDIKLSKADLKDIFSYRDIPDCETHDLLHCSCQKSGKVLSEQSPTEEQRECQLGGVSSSTPAYLRINELMSWEHHGPPIDPDLLNTLCVGSTESSITFLFKNSSAR